MKILKSEYGSRITKCQSKLGEKGIDALLVSEEEDIYYLTGLTYKSLERLFLLIIKKENVEFILPQMELAHLKEVDHVDQIKCYWEYPAKAPDRWQDILYDSVKNQVVGLSPKTPYEIGHCLSSKEITIKESNIIEELRWIKSDTELALIRDAAKYCDDAICKLNDTAYYGMSELEVFSIGNHIQQRLIKKTPFNYLSTNVLVAAWPSRIAHQPHGVPKVSDLLVEGTHISLSFLRVNGYSAELERTFFTSTPTTEQQKYFDIMLQAREASYAALQPGETTASIDEAARKVFIEAGLEKYIMHRTGHGIGLGNHEGPYLAIGDNTILKENMVVSIEPGIYIEGVGGFRHSDTVRITKDGYEILTNCPTDIESLTFTKYRPLQRLKGAIIKRMFKIK